jgi:hypothetical protein
VLHVDPWAKAAECERAIERVADPERRSVLEDLRSFWIELGHELAPVDRRDGADLRSTLIHLDTHVSTIAQIHAELMATCRSAMH